MDLCPEWEQIRGFNCLREVGGGASMVKTESCTRERRMKAVFSAFAHFPGTFSGSCSIVRSIVDFAVEGEGTHPWRLGKHNGHFILWE